MPKNDNIKELEPTYATCSCGEEVLLSYVLTLNTEARYIGKCPACEAKLVLLITDV
ncbi:hypothetical protein LCGC14_0957500 [marine sediment metagenome]|uniref:Uncharacterized protein n=1 Tax=marine sediment metagenome TaxID=412755 RepID=A0A0F9QYU5_9ZZZZ